MNKRYLALLAAFTFAVALPLFAASSPKGGILYTFKGGSDGQSPVAPLVADAKGNLYGTTVYGGDAFCINSPSCGTVFELVAPSSPSGIWHEKILYAFTGQFNGFFPAGGLIFDSAGNLYGTTEAGGDLDNTLCPDGMGCGTVFEVSPPKTAGGAWTETVLHMFESGTDGAYPQSSLIFDANGNLYGTALAGTLNDGVVFELSPAGGGAWTESVLYSFTGLDDGSEPYGPLVFDAAGDLYGTTSAGGSSNVGTVFQLTPSAGGGSWTETSLVVFDGSNGAAPLGGVLIDSAGNLFGTTSRGGANKDGIAFELIPQRVGAWTEVVLHSFVGGNDARPNGFAEDAAGSLYGAATGNDNCGEVFKLSNSASGWSESVLHSFTNSRFGLGCSPQAPLVYGKWKALYGTTYEGGSAACGDGLGCGTVFGFLP